MTKTEKLAAIGVAATATPEEIDRAIGNHPHTYVTCPDAPAKRRRWQSADPVTEALTRPLITKTVQILASSPGFYKLPED